MSELGNPRETVADNQHVDLQKKIKKIFGHLDYSNPPEVCPVRDVLSVASDKWSILVILYLGGYKVLRFNELKKTLYGISSKTLSEKLKSLEFDGYVLREQYPEVPIRVEYSLTSFGMRYANKLIELTEWMDNEKETILRNREHFTKK